MWCRSFWRLMVVFGQPPQQFFSIRLLSSLFTLGAPVPAFFKMDIFLKSWTRAMTITIRKYSIIEDVWRWKKYFFLHADAQRPREKFWLIIEGKYSKISHIGGVPALISSKLKVWKFFLGVRTVPDSILIKSRYRCTNIWRGNVPEDDLSDFS